MTTVVPRKGDVDRNIGVIMAIQVILVVPRKGDVDRNAAGNKAEGETWKSSPARGTWIEIMRVN